MKPIYLLMNFTSHIFHFNQIVPIMEYAKSLKTIVNSKFVTLGLKTETMAFVYELQGFLKPYLTIT